MDVGRHFFFGLSNRISIGFNFCGYREELDAYGLVRRLRIDQWLEIPDEDQPLVVPVGHFVGGLQLRENLDHLRGGGGYFSVGGPVPQLYNETAIQQVLVKGQGNN